VPTDSFETKYPVDLIDQILQVKGADYLRDELAREEEPNYAQMDLEFGLQAYFPDENFVGKRILDFGNGSGASTMVLARFFSDAEIVGIELDSKFQSIAKSRLIFYDYKNMSFQLSPSGSEIPANIGQFDLVILSAVYEHLLPSERKFVIPMIWKHVSELWEAYLRRGIRGATETEILATSQEKSTVKLLEQRGEGIKDRIDLWYCRLNQEKNVVCQKNAEVNAQNFKVRNRYPLST
jgi:hypothetical protein